MKMFDITRRFMPNTWDKSFLQTGLFHRRDRRIIYNSSAIKVYRFKWDCGIWFIRLKILIKIGEICDKFRQTGGLGYDI